MTPHAKGAKTDETLDGVRIARYRYAPAALETLVNGGGIVGNLRRAPWKWLLVPGLMLAMAWSTWRQVRRWRPDVIHAHWLIPQGVIAAALDLLMKDARPFVVTSHGADLFALRAAPLQWMKRWVARRARGMSVVSRAMRNEAGRIGIDEARIAVEPMGVDLSERFHVDERSTRSDNELLFVGRLVEKKGLGHLIAAMPTILRARPDVRLTIVGFGPLETAYRRQVKESGLAGAVTFLGAHAQDQLPPHYRRAAVFVAPFVEAASGDREGLGLVLVEAIGCGCPVVVGDIAAVHDVVSPDTALIVPADDATALAQACLAALEDPVGARRRAELARRDVAQRFDWSERARAYRSLLHDAVG